MASFTKKQQIAILIVGIVLVFTLGTRFGPDREYEPESELKEVELENDESFEDGSEPEGAEKENAEMGEDLVVYVKGAVKYPGILKVKQGTRIADVLEEAGGPEEGADFNGVNLAKKVQDEEMVHVPYIGEEVQAIEKSDTGNGSPSESTGSDSGITVNINTASKEELKSLSGIGDVTAEKIISYRENNRFETIEDIMDVSGIGEKKFEAIKDSIVAN